MRKNAPCYGLTPLLCNCGSVAYITNAWGTAIQQVTTFSYDNQGNRMLENYADGYNVTNWFNALQQVTVRGDGTANRWFYYNNQGLLTNVLNAYGPESTKIYDALDREVYTTNASGVGVVSTFDNLGRVLTRAYPDSGVERFGYSAAGPIAYTNQLNRTNFFGYDTLARKSYETNANGEVLKYTNSTAGDLLSLTDGKNQTTQWKYDIYGRVTNKVDQAGTVILKYAYDADSRLLSRWSSAKGTTYYTNDSLGNLTYVKYPVSPSVSFQYDALNRRTLMIDRMGTTVYAYTAGNQLLTESQPFASSTVTNQYVNRLRTSLSLQQPSGVWTNKFIYDLAGHLTNVTSAAGIFGYSLGAGSPGSALVKKLLLPNTSYITNTFDNVARLTGTFLDNSSGGILDSAAYGFNQANQRTTYTNAAGTYVQYGYDNIGQLKVGTSSVSTENRGYYYDTAWNLNRRTNNGTVTTFTFDSRNQLSGGYSYDANGNLIAGTGTSGYDDENRLLSFTNGNYRSDFAYDGLGRMRTDTEYTWSGSAWVSNSTTELIYDGNRVIQERDGNNNPGNSYVRGTDLSGTMEGAGGIGGLLAFVRGPQIYFYHADGNGNITSFESTSQTISATHRYDPFGNLISSSGIAGVNPYRFSSQRTTSAGYAYLYRFYDPGTQRWLNRDPIEDLGFIILTGHVPVRGAVDPNVYLFVANKPVNAIDALGLTLYYCTVPTKGFPLFGLGRHGYLWNDATGDECGQESSCGSGPTSSHNGGPGPNDKNPTRKGRLCTPIDGSQGADASNAALMAWCHEHANDGVWVPGAHDCHNVVNKCLNHGNLGGVNPGRFGPQPIFSPIPGLSAAVP